MTPQVAIVITTHNGYPFTRWCLESISCTLAPGSYEIVIVDNGSSDETLKLEREYEFARNPGQSLYESWNLGIAASKSDWVLCTNNDVFFCTPDWWRWMQLALEGELDWAYPDMVETQAVVPDMYSRIRRALDLKELEVRPERGTLAGCCFALHRSLLEEVGPFDPQFEVWYGEKDYEIRLLQAGKRYGRVANAVTRHFGASTIQLGTGDPGNFTFEPTGSAFGHEERARRDYERFRHRHRATPLESLGLRMPPFGPHPLKAR